MNNNYYQSDIKTSRQEHSIYAMRYASQQMLIDKLQKQLEAYENMRKDVKDKLIFYRGRLINTYVIGYSDIDDLLNILNKVGGSDE